MAATPPADEWDELYAEAQVLSQEDAEKIDDACAAAESSESEYASSEAVDTCWWVSKCRQAFAHQGLLLPHAPQSTLLVMSCCTVCSAESAVLEARPQSP